MKLYILLIAILHNLRLHKNIKHDTLSYNDRIVHHQALSFHIVIDDQLYHRVVNQQKLNPNHPSFSRLKCGNDLIDDIMDRSSWQNLLSTQAETVLITVLGKTLLGMVIAMFAVFACAPPVPTVRIMLASSWKFIQDCFPFCDDIVITFPTRHGHAIRKHDGATLRRQFVLGPSCSVCIILALKFEPEKTPQTSLRNESAELG